jgi:4'-phosphopantetheinyl transferase
MTADKWQLMRYEPILSISDVHVWMSWLDLPADRITQFASTLTEDEIERAERFHFERDRNRYVVSRGLLRELLGRYLKRNPAQVRLIYGPNGKPELAGYEADHTLQFNLAHSGEIALYAFTQGRPIGIDVEKVRTLSDADGLAKRFFSAKEYLAWRSLARGDRLAAFFRCWTSKEAFIKAIGAGLSYPLDQFDVTLSPDEPAGLLAIAGDVKEAKRWSVRALYPAQDYAAAVVALDDWRLSRWRWE